ncbi:hypothetical protein IQ265_05185 [Nodosilinea sp. LEGE 06152]|uniref:hypothetical protein n=1 Tax=Nodosilinea sp. LEGE 06152 TaxID=2777966 RepID=UPI00187FDC23|nr:hypothetical protein [Nodosilinea sp. LEGE 06152]MBE9156224.1 hypothetical protein [Nodosilinea sp. LEGE 06152]
MIPPLPPSSEHPWPTGHVFQSPGAHLTYRVVGPCCRLFDRDQLPWPCCRLQWRGKEPSWRRIGKRLVPDMATRKSPSYCVEIVGQGYGAQSFVTTLYTAKLDRATQSWWHTRLHRDDAELVKGSDRTTRAEGKPPSEKVCNKIDI